MFLGRWPQAFGLRPNGRSVCSGAAGASCARTCTLGHIQLREEPLSCCPPLQVQPRSRLYLCWSGARPPGPEEHLNALGLHKL